MILHSGKIADLGSKNVFFSQNKSNQKKVSARNLPLVAGIVI